jgi:flavin-dependent dehydrogenase
MDNAVTVIGAGPAGSTAALAACREGAAVRLYEKSKFPRHKVCGEFLSPEAARFFEKLGILDSFLDLRPFAVREAKVWVGRTVKQWKLEEPAYGISRYALDRFLLERASAAGAELIREPAKPERGPTVVAIGRQRGAVRGRRLFGFKAHFSGTVNDRIDLLFDGEMYAGINCVEDGATNVCGLASEALLQRHQFRPDALIDAIPRLAERMKPLTRKMEWLLTGPLVLGGQFDAPPPDSVYPAGDALGFVDPFTGSGMLSAIVTGYLAGRSSARGVPSPEYLRDCRKLLAAPYRAAAVLRKMLEWGVASHLARLAPGNTLFQLTRPGFRAGSGPEPI